MEMHVRRERMSAEFEKFHLGDGRVLHFFTGVDRGGPHDHPWDFTSKILVGGYVERVYTPHDDGTWSSELIRREVDDVFDVRAEHIHEIVELPRGICQTMVLAGPSRRETRFRKFDNEGVTSRAWHETAYS